MKIVSMSGSLRENVGKKDAKKLRAQGLVPCVLYGGSEQLHFATDSTEFKDIVFTPEVCYVNVELGDRNVRAILQDIQYHPVSDAILHADFLEVFDDKPVVMHIPVRTKGNSKGILAGGKLSMKLRRLKVKAMPDMMPEYIVLDITNLGIGDNIKVRDIKVNGFELLDLERAVVVGIVVTRSAKSAGFDEEEEEGGEEAEGGEASEGGDEAAKPASE